MPFKGLDKTMLPFWVIEYLLWSSPFREAEGEDHITVGPVPRFNFWATNLPIIARFTGLVIIAYRCGHADP